MARRRLHVKATADNVMTCPPQPCPPGRQRQIARNNPVCEPVSFAGHLVRVSVARRGPRLNPMPPRRRGAASANTVRWRCQPG
jgi:hypothetical protein